MFNKRETALSLMVVSAILVASFFAISFVQQALAQGNTSAGGNMSSAGGAMMNKTGANQTGGAMMNQTGGNMTK
jgi:hypothetical protein